MTSRNTGIVVFGSRINCRLDLLYWSACHCMVTAGPVACASCGLHWRVNLWQSLDLLVHGGGNCCLYSVAVAGHSGWSWCLSWLVMLHSKIKKYFRAPSLVLWLVTTWKDHNRNIFIQVDHNFSIVDLPGTDWSFQVLTRVPHLWIAEAPKMVLWSTLLTKS